MIAPATFQAASDLGVRSNIVIAMMTSIFILGFGQLYHLLLKRNIFILNPAIDYISIYSFWTSCKFTPHLLTRVIMFIVNTRFWDH